MSGLDETQRKVLAISLLGSGALAGFYGGATMIQTADGAGRTHDTLWYVLGGGSLATGLICLILAVAIGLSLRGQQGVADARHLLEDIAVAARRLVRFLTKLPITFPALSDPTFDDQLPDGQPATHEVEMRDALFSFVNYLANLRVLHQNHRDAPLHDQIWSEHKAVQRTLGGPFDSAAIGADLSLNADQSHLIAVRATTQDEGQPGKLRVLNLDELLTRCSSDAQFRHYLQPLRNLLMGAGQGTKCRERLERTQEALERLRNRLIAEGYDPS